MNLFRAFALLCAFPALTLFAADTATASTAFPKEVSYNAAGKDYTLELTGTGTRKKFFVTVYQIGSYIQNASSLSGDKAEAILNSDAAKQLTMKFQHDAPADKIREGYLDSFKSILTEADYNAEKADIDRFVAFFNQDLKVGDELVLRSIPGGTVQVLINGKEVGTIANPALAKSLWGFWFGPKAVVDKNKLSGNS